MANDKNEKSVAEAIEYCHRHRSRFLAEAYACGEDGEEQFECLVGCLESGHIKPEELSSYGMEFDDDKEGQVTAEDAIGDFCSNVCPAEIAEGLQMHCYSCPLQPWNGK